MRWISLLSGLLLAFSAWAADDLPLSNIVLPKGFAIELVVRLPNARQMALGDGNVLYVGSREAGKVYAVELGAGYRALKTHVIADGLQMPVGVAWHPGNKDNKGSLYVSAVSRILRFDGLTGHLEHPPRPVAVADDLPRETHHGWKFIAFGPDGKLYVPVGAPCNICEPDPDRYALILRMGADGGGREVVARGVRNSVGFDWNPQGGSLWFTDNGRDLLGDDAPPDELNRAPRAGLNFGYPYCHGGDIPDPEYGAKQACNSFTPPARKLGAHVAALGMRFYRGKRFPQAYQGAIFIAEHGSWNRSKKVGYRVTVVRIRDDQAVSYEPFATGWLQGERAWGRPADLLVLPDGSLLVSDDLAGAIYRITYRP